MLWDFRRSGAGRPAVLRQCARAATPIRDLGLVEVWRELGLAKAVRKRLPFSYARPNSIGAAATLLAFWLSVAVDAERFDLTSAETAR